MTQDVSRVSLSTGFRRMFELSLYRLGRYSSARGPFDTTSYEMSLECLRNNDGARSSRDGTNHVEFFTCGR